MEVCGSGTPIPEAVSLKFPCVCKSGIVVPTKVKPLEL